MPRNKKSPVIDKKTLHGFFLVELQSLETYISAMKRDFEEEKYVSARYYTTEIVSRAANMNGTLAGLDHLKK